MITVLRLSHRPERDKRLSTHVALVARAFGASKLIYSGLRDKKMEQTIEKVANVWGGDFQISYEKNWRKVIEKFNGFKLQLTMYGLDYKKQISKIKKQKNVLVVVGGEKVPWEVYEMVDLNVGVTNQPHSEAGALAVLLENLKLKRNFSGAERRIMPCKKGKNIKKAIQNIK